MQGTRTKCAWPAVVARTALIVPTEHLQGMTALGTGLILWVSAVITLVMAFLVVRHTPLLDRAETATSGSPE